MDLKGKRVVVVGLGKSGVAAARLCLEQGAKVSGVDDKPPGELSYDVQNFGMTLEPARPPELDYRGYDLVVVSPGVPAFEALRLAEQAGVEIVSELELASRFLSAPIIAVGGTNGKSTATVLLGHFFEAAEQRVFTGGNLGVPLSEAVGQELDVAVVEVSSFQLERVSSFRPKVSLLLNITEDHLDRYDGFSAYADAKGNAFVRQQSTDFAVCPVLDAECQRQARRGQGTLILFGATGDYVVEATDVVETATGERFSMSTVDLYGRHNLNNAAAAIASARALRLSPEAITEGLARFRALPHRMALVGEVRGVRFYDDSKATNVGAAVTALTGLTEEKGVLIAGGRDKHGSYAPLVEALKAKARAVVLIGEAGDRIAEAVGDQVRIERADSMGAAVEYAFALARPGDAVLLSPACSSLDRFKSYAERGDRFIAAVERLRARHLREGRRR